jgi:hypothetical protein
MKLFPLLALMLTGCGYNPAVMQPKIAAMSDAELMRHNQMVNTGIVPDVNPQAEWTLAEMKRRGLIGAGRDGIPGE